MKVYIAGPMTKGDVAMNVREGIKAGQRLLFAGHHPYVPHLTHFWHIVFPGPLHQWLDLDLAWLAMCHALVRLPGDSEGADLEVLRAHELRIPVYEGLAAFFTTYPIEIEKEAE